MKFKYNYELQITIYLMNTKQRIIFIYIYNIFYGDDNINNL